MAQFLLETVWYCKISSKYSWPKSSKAVVIYLYWHQAILVADLVATSGRQLTNTQLDQISSQLFECLPAVTEVCNKCDNKQQVVLEINPRWLCRIRSSMSSIWSLNHLDILNTYLKNILVWLLLFLKGVIQGSVMRHALFLQLFEYGLSLWNLGLVKSVGNTKQETIAKCTIYLFIL